MSEAPAQDPQPAAPVLVHAGTYALYQTPAGGYHLSYRREWSTDETGRQAPVDAAPDIHCRDLSPRAAELFASVLDRDTPVPPVIAAFLDGGKMPSLGQVIRQVRQFGGALEGQPDEPDEATLLARYAAEDEAWDAAHPEGAPDGTG